MCILEVTSGSAFFSQAVQRARRIEVDRAARLREVPPHLGEERLAQEEGVSELHGRVLHSGRPVGRARKGRRGAPRQERDDQKIRRAPRRLQPQIELGGAVRSANLRENLANFLSLVQV